MASSWGVGAGHGVGLALGEAQLSVACGCNDAPLPPSPCPSCQALLIPEQVNTVSECRWCGCGGGLAGRWRFQLKQLPKAEEQQQMGVGGEVGEVGRRPVCAASPSFPV